MSDHLNFMLLGLGNGAVFVALAISLVTTYKSSGVVNFATGAMASHAAYTYAFLRQGEFLVPIPGLPKTVRVADSLPTAPAIAMTLAFEAVVGVLLFLLVFRPLRHHLAVARAMASLGVMVVLTATLFMQVGGDQVLVDPMLPRDRWTFGGLRVISDRVWLVVIIVAVAAVLGCMYRFTAFGMATRAATETEVGAIVSGLSPERISIVNWAISAVVAGLAGILISPLVPLVPGTYTLFIVPALAAAVLGRFSVMSAAVIGGLLIGVLQSEAVFLQNSYSWFPSSGTAELIPLVIVLLVLVARGKPLPARGSLVERTLGSAPRPTSVRLPLAIGFPIAAALVFVLDDSYRSALIESFIVAIIALSLVVVTGYLGQVSLAQLTLAGAAAYLLSRFSDQWNIPFPLSPLLAATGAMVIGVVVGLPALRIRGMLVAVVTLTLAVALDALWFRNSDLNGGIAGAKVANPSIFGIDLGIGTGLAFPRVQFGLLCLLTLTTVAVAVAKLRQSALGSAMLAVRANERSAAAAGINVVGIKIVGFAIGSFIAGLGGCLLAYKQTVVSYQSYDVLVGLALFSTVFLIGVTSVSGGLAAGLFAVGGLAFVFFNRRIEIGQWYGIVSGIGLIVTVIRNPDGAIGPLHHSIERRRVARSAATEEQPAPPLDPALLVPSTNGDTSFRLSISGLAVSYGGVRALDGVSFDIPPHSIIGVIGPNGAGKTTLMDAICGFARCVGVVRLAGRDVSGLGPHARARLGLGRTFQGLDLYDDLTVDENVVVGQYVRRHDSSDTGAVLGLLGIANLRERKVGELSQGQRQLVSIARALAGRPDVVLLDEPAAGLDSSESAWLADRLRVVRAAGTSIVLVDHDMHFVMNLCDTIHVLDFGQLIASGPPAEVRADGRVAAAYLGSSHAGAPA